METTHQMQVFANQHSLVGFCHTHVEDVPRRTIPVLHSCIWWRGLNSKQLDNRYNKRFIFSNRAEVHQQPQPTQADQQKQQQHGLLQIFLRCAA